MRKLVDFTDLKITRIKAYQVDLPLHEGVGSAKLDVATLFQFMYPRILVAIRTLLITFATISILFDRTTSRLLQGSYKWADGKSVSAFDATVVRIETNYGKCEVR